MTKRERDQVGKLELKRWARDLRCFLNDVTVWLFLIWKRIEFQRTGAK